MTLENTEPIMIGITGTSGAGKTTVCESLINESPEIYGMIQLDDYFQPESEVPVFASHKNWDDPRALYLAKLANDLIELKQGKSIVALTKNAARNPNYKKTQKRIPSTFEPRPVMFVEGFLVLQNDSVRKSLDYSIWLDFEFEKGWERRTHFKGDHYFENVFKPMFEKNVLPTKELASLVLDVSDLDAQTIKEKVKKQVAIWRSLPNS